MALFTFLRFLTPNATVSVSEAAGDLSTTAALGQAMENLDTYAARTNGTNTGTSAMTLDMSAASDTTGLRAPNKAGAAPILAGATAFDSSTGLMAYGNGSITVKPGNTLTNSIAGDVSLNNTANYFDGPTVAQGTTGTWLASGTVTMSNTAGAEDFDVKLWDGTTVIDSTVVTLNTINKFVTASVSGRITSPAGNIRISVKGAGSTSSLIKANSSGLSKDSTITVQNIA